MFVLFLILFSLIISNLSLADEVGCCVNPGAGALVCSLDRLVLRDKECCPKPETNFTQYYKSTKNPDAPANYNNCTTNFFFANADCSTINACVLGCCCSGSGGSITSEAQCKGTDLTFFEGETDCSIACPTPQCNDGIDNDNNGCTDFDGGDLGCSSIEDTNESGGSCSSQVSSCSDSEYTPKLSNLTITPARGQKKFFLTWRDECKQNALSYEISRCKGNACTNFVLVSTTSINSFEDSSDELLFDSTYSYQIKARYSPQTAAPTITNTATLGNAQCLGHTTDDAFCYNNSAFFCDSSNKLIAEGTKCSSQQICTASGKKASCISKSGCNSNLSNPFGMYDSITGCESNTYCFYDRSHTTVDSCFPCDPSMACYDYKTEKTCLRDNCNVNNCNWKTLLNSTGIGVCINSIKPNCQWCDQKGTKSMQNLKSYNEVFDICTKSKSDALSEGQFKCYFSDQKSMSCSDVVCTDYKTDQCSSAQITHDENNKIVNPSNDQCGIKVCQNINGVCAKNADGDDKPDCTTLTCEKDYFSPITSLSPVINSKNILESLIVQISDKTSNNGSEILRTTPDYTTYLCAEPCGLDGHPYNTSTNAFSLVLSNLKIFDSSNGKQLLTLKDGFSVLRYYSQDAAKNIGRVKKLTVEAHSNTTGPKIFNITVTGGNKVGGKIYTKNQKPTITVQFYEPAIITFARIVSKDKTKVITLQGSQTLGTKVDLIVPETLANGEYKFELNAKNKDNIFMDPPASEPIVIDNIKPKINITPSNGTVLTKSSVKINLQFDKEVTLDTVTLNSEEIKETLSTLDNKLFSITLNLTDGLKVLEISASSFSMVQVTSSSSFIVDALPTIISLIQPKFGVSPTYTFDLKVETDNDAECRYALDKNFDFEFMDPFTTTGGTLHTIPSFDKIKKNDSTIHKLNVKCQDERYGIAFKQFDLSVDTTSPEIISAFAFPNPVIEKPATTTLTVQTDDSAVCKYSTQSKSFDAMELQFSGFENNTFKTINKQNVTLESAGSYKYFVACRNKAGLLSSVEGINFSVDFSLLMKIISHTPEFFGVDKVTLDIETTKKAQCLYSETDKTARSGDLFSTPSGYFHQQQLNLSEGKYTFYVVCKDQFLQAFSEVAIINFTIDLTAPVMLFVNDTSTFELFPEKTCLLDRLRVKFLAEDQGSKVSEYFYSLFKKLDNKQLLNFIKTYTGGEWIWVENLNLSDNAQYYFGVKSKNVVGLQSTVKSSDGITVDKSICQAKPICGDGLINLAGEECDKETFGTVYKCTQYTNFTGGILKCTDDCKLDPSDCDCSLNATSCTKEDKNCGNDKLDIGELCDGTNFGAIKDTSCKAYSSLFINGTIKCVDCSINTQDCVPKPVPKCGDGIINLAGELCDNNTFGLINKCTQYTNFIGGTLKCKDDCLLDTSDCIERPTCGNSQLDPGESCDGTVFGIVNGCNDYASFSGGTLKCTEKCDLDTSGCIEKTKCGNGIIDKGESCDGTNLGPITGKCTDYKPNLFTGGNITCSSCQFDTSKCKGTVGTCGDGIVNVGESCDGTIFGSIEKCTDYSSSFTGGTLKCTSSCKLDTSGCIEKAKCGNGIVDKNESCDTDKLGFNGNKCVDYSLDFSNGIVDCTDDCKLDTSGCTKASTCGNNRIDSGELCDGTKFFNLTDLRCSAFSSTFLRGNITCSGCQISTDDCELNTPPKCGDGKINQAGEECDTEAFGTINKCTQYTNFIGGSLKCTNDCKIDTSGCTKVETCGNKELDPGESCDGTIFGSIEKCTNYNVSFTGGTLKCTSSCQLDTSGCTEKTNKCGNGIIDKGESCDGSNLGPLSGKCTDYSSNFISGHVKCTSECKIDTDDCSKKAANCGNDVLDTGEVCDGDNFGDITDLRCSNYTQDFVGGTLKCASCKISTANCLTEGSNVKIRCKDKGDCKVNEDCSDNSDCASRYCSNSKCTQATCSDGVKNQGESSIDCGGPCDKCQNGKSCNTNDECQSDFCYFGTCKAPEVCLDGKLSPGEADIDCGGICPSKCLSGKNCDSDKDCEENSKCKSSKCTTCAAGDTTCSGTDKNVDSDGDGIPDQWEIDNGLNPNDPSDANKDPDKDGLTNLEEYDVQKTYGKGTNPNSKDTDGDGFSDKEELDKGTNPLDPEDFPKSSFGKTILIIVGILVLISGFGYLAYSSFSKKKRERFELETPRTVSRVTIPSSQPRQPPIRGRVMDARITELLKKKQEEKQKEREGFLKAFVKEDAEKPKEELKENKKEVAKDKHEKQKEQRKIVKKFKRKQIPKKPKEDVFIKLQELAKENKRKVNKKNDKK